MPLVLAKICLQMKTFAQVERPYSPNIVKIPPLTPLIHRKNAASGRVYTRVPSPRANQINA